MFLPGSVIIFLCLIVFCIPIGLLLSFGLSIRPFGGPLLVLLLISLGLDPSSIHNLTVDEPPGPILQLPKPSPDIVLELAEVVVQLSHNFGVDALGNL
jgi:hypothetical protein